LICAIKDAVSLTAHEGLDIAFEFSELPVFAVFFDFFMSARDKSKRLWG